MLTIKDMIRHANTDGYYDDNAEAKVCQVLTPGRKRHSEAERNSQSKARRNRQCISLSFLS